jgi:hypothetical protein
LFDFYGMANFLIKEKRAATKKIDSYWLKQQLGTVCSLGHIQACICPGSGSQANCNHSGDISLLNLICAGKFYLYEGDFYSSHRILSDISEATRNLKALIKIPLHTWVESVLASVVSSMATSYTITPSVIGHHSILHRTERQNETSLAICNHTGGC